MFRSARIVFGRTSPTGGSTSLTVNLFWLAFGLVVARWPGERQGAAAIATS